MKRLMIIAAVVALLCACQESLEQRAQREAREYTAKYCPTPVDNHTRTDSVVFDMTTRTYHYYCSVVDILDDEEVFALNRDKMAASLLKLVRENTGFRGFKKVGFSFAWTIRSEKDPKKVYFNKVYTPSEYNNQ